MITIVRNQLARRWGLAIGDVAVFGLFAAVGRGAHRGSVDLLELLNIAAPFALSWLATAPWMGMYNNNIVVDVKRIMGRTALTWAIAGPLGLGLRQLVWGKDVPVSFAITTLIINLVLLELWRSSMAVYLSRKELI